jgi:tetratricopeptide (TPR) repeat protein
VEYKHVRLWTAVAVLCFSSSAWGRVSEADSVKGEVHGGWPDVRGAVSLSDFDGRSVGSAEVRGDGSFEFRHVPYGNYRLTVLDGGEQPIHEELISVGGQMQPILVEVMRREPQRPPSGTVPAAELLHRPTKKAFQAFLAAQKLADAGAHDRAAGQLAKAVQLSPGYADAWVNLAAQHIFLRRYEQALQELAHASEISQPTAVILGDMAYAQYALHRYAEGTHSARQALQLDPSNASAHYLLGSFLALDRRTLAEGVRHLEVAARTMLAAQGSLERARRDSAQLVTRR